MQQQTYFESNVASVSQQFSTVLAAPIPFLLVVGIVAFVIWKFLGKYQKLKSVWEQRTSKQGQCPSL
jgi:hypothetical protein